MFRDSANISAIVCSAVLSVLPPGVFITTMPCRVAASLSILSVPTPARTIAFRRRFPSSASAVIFTPLRQIAPSNCCNVSRSSSPFRPVRTSYSMPGAAASSSRPSGASVSRTTTRGMTTGCWMFDVSYPTSNIQPHFSFAFTYSYQQTRPCSPAASPRPPPASRCKSKPECRRPIDAPSNRSCLALRRPL